jgi:hypothetical protein
MTSLGTGRYRAGYLTACKWRSGMPPGAPQLLWPRRRIDPSHDRVHLGELTHFVRQLGDLSPDCLRPDLGQDSMVADGAGPVTCWFTVRGSGTCALTQGGAPVGAGRLDAVAGLGARNVTPSSAAIPHLTENLWRVRGQSIS